MAPKRSVAPKCAICVVPRQGTVEPLKKLLPGYRLVPASSATAASRLGPTESCDIYIVHSREPVDDPAAVCRRLRRRDKQTPIVVYAHQPSERERRETMSSGAQAYVGRSDDPQNLRARVAQLVMLAELRGEAVPKTTR